MRSSILLFLILFIFYNAFAQNSSKEFPVPKTEAEIDKILKETVNKSFDNPKQKEQILSQLKLVSEKLGYESGILQSGDKLIKLYLDQSRNKEAVDLGNQLKKIAQNKKDPQGYISSIYRRSALALSYLGLDDASLKDFKTAIKYAETVENVDNKNYLMSLCYENMTGYFINKQLKNLKLRDSIVYYLDKSRETTKKIGDNSKTVSNYAKHQQLAFVDMRMGIFYLEQAQDIKGSVSKAEKYLQEALEFYEDKKYNTLPDERIMMLNQMSWLYLEKKEYQKSVDFAKRSLVLEKQYSAPDSRVESFEFLAGAYLELGEKEKSKSYMRDFTSLKDSISFAVKNDTDATMTKMVAQVADDHNTDRRRLLIGIGVLFLLIAFSTFFVWRRKSRLMRIKYERMIEMLKGETQRQPVGNNEETELADDNTPIESETDLESDIASGKTILPAETEARILKRLLAFEKSERFLKKDLNIGLLSGQLNTNSKYLSEVIKVYRAQGFSHYINKLRINYIVRKLYNEPKYREYKISYLAEECGYASSQVFVIAFKKINGVTPSYFIDSLKEDESLVLH